MKKAIMCILIYVLLVTQTGCAKTKGLKQFKNSKISQEFDNTLKNYYYEEDGAISLTIYSLSKEVSSIKTIALQNLLSKKNVDIFDMTDNLNPFISLCKNLFIQ